MKKLFQLLALSGFCLFTSKINSQTSKDSVLYFKENVALIDALVRSVDREHYVKEMYFKDFNGSMKLPDIFEYDGVAFNDNGLGYDLNANDGIYTSVAQYLHSSKVPYQSHTNARSVLENSIVDFRFAHKSGLADFLTSYNVPGGSGKIKFSFDCDVYVCSCSSCSCRTCWATIVSPTGGYLGMVTHCLKVVNCHISVGWG